MPSQSATKEARDTRAGRRQRIPLHWREWWMEAAGLGCFMLSACLFTALLEHPHSPLRQALPSPLARRALMGLAMGATAVGIIYSPFGKRSGAHLNPALTATFLRLGKVTPADAGGYVFFQFAGGLLGVLGAKIFLRSMLAHPAVNYAVTLPGIQGSMTAFAAELAMSFGMMILVLESSSRKRWAPFTGVFAGLLLALYISALAPLSGMSLNPARTLASAVPSRAWTGLWIYFTAPPLGMLLAAQAFLWRRGRQTVACPKLYHGDPRRCIFCQTRRLSEESNGVSEAILETPRNAGGA